MTLEYYRNYTTYSTIGQQYNISASYCLKSTVFVEDTLASHPDLALPGKDALANGDYDSVAIDATESPIERPKKTREVIILGKKDSIR
jgi:hypothetical protein